MRHVKRVAAACALTALVFAGSVRAQDASKVRLGQIGLSFYAVTAGVVQEVLERLGHRVEVTTGSHAQIFPRLGAGEVDLLVAAWLPHGHALYWEQYGARARQLGVLYQGARFEWMVPVYVPPAEVSSVDDLRKPEVLARMEKTIQGTGRDSGNMMLSAQVMQAYDLERAGYRLQPGTLSEFHGAYDRHLAQRKWFVMPLWRPHYINRLGTMRAIAEPRRLLGPASDGTLVASREWAAIAPPRTLSALHRMHLGLDAVAEMDRLVNVERMTPREAARTWMQMNRDQVEAWFAGS
jgi:glycine betaine/proline transport system substrate-binding protein